MPRIQLTGLPFLYKTIWFWSETRDNLYISLLSGISVSGYLRRRAVTSPRLLKYARSNTVSSDA